MFLYFSHGGMGLNFHVSDGTMYPKIFVRLILVLYKYGLVSKIYIFGLYKCRKVLWGKFGFIWTTNNGIYNHFEEPGYRWG